MKKAKEVRKNEIGNECSLHSMEGTVIFSETIPTEYGSCLDLKLDFFPVENIRWQNAFHSPVANIQVGNKIRGFYDTREIFMIYLEAYELMDEKGNVLTRARQKGYNFIDSVD